MASALVHLDESCLGNGRNGENPGGGAGLIEVRVRSGVERRDFYLSEPSTTNNRMALAGAAEALRILSGKDRRLAVRMVSDSEYLVKGMREWVPGWIGRSWTRKGGAIMNIELWQALVEAADGHEVTWTWVRGHKGHPKNEYADRLAVRAARDQLQSNGPVPSAFLEWLEAERKKGKYLEYDPDSGV